MDAPEGIEGGPAAQLEAPPRSRPLQQQDGQHESVGYSGSKAHRLSWTAPCTTGRRAGQPASTMQRYPLTVPVGDQIVARAQPGLEWRAAAGHRQRARLERRSSEDEQQRAVEEPRREDDAERHDVPMSTTGAPRAVRSLPRPDARVLSRHHHAGISSRDRRASRAGR